jgi:hypothetical protein
MAELKAKKEMHVVRAKIGRCGLLRCSIRYQIPDTAASNNPLT